jgi:16S rRNA (guanine(966)-N(2))-methyltransferase RsmD
MRIIGGTHRGKVLHAPKDLPVRPTTDFAKEALFNILHNRIDFYGIQVLDLFSGTGHISMEFASRGAQAITAVDMHFKCVRFIDSTAKELQLNIHAVKSDVFDFLQKSGGNYHVVFADPPYDMPNIADIHANVFTHGHLRAGGVLIIEHGSKTDLSNLAGYEQTRKYGNVRFSFFQG